MNGWLQIEGRIHALPARRGDEEGSYLWLAAGERGEAVEAELYLPAVVVERLDGAMGVATGIVASGGEQRFGTVTLQFGRVGDGRGVVSAGGDLLDADVRFELLMTPPDGGFCAHCGGQLEVPVVDVITPPDGGLIGAPRSRCPGCGRS